MAYKSINDLIDQKTTDLYNEYGAFYAFGKKQFDEKKKPGVKYASLFSGLICPSETAKEMLDKLEQIFDAGKKEFLEINTTEQIIKYDLANHEAYYLGDPSETVENLKEYGISEEEIYKVFKKEYQRYIDEDLF